MRKALPTDTKLLPSLLPPNPIAPYGLLHSLGIKAQLSLHFTFLWFYYKIFYFILFKGPVLF